MIVEIKYRTTTYSADVFKYGDKEYPFVVTDLKDRDIDDYIIDCKKEANKNPKEQVLLLCKHVKYHKCPDGWSQESWERGLKDNRNLWGAKLVDKK
jgi:hypothetical protein